MCWNRSPSLADTNCSRTMRIVLVFVVTFVKLLSKDIGQFASNYSQPLLYITLTRSIRDLAEISFRCKDLSEILSPWCGLSNILVILRWKNIWRSIVQQDLCKGRNVLRSNQAEYTSTITHALARLLYISGRMGVSWDILAHVRRVRHTGKALMSSCGLETI